MEGLKAKMSTLNYRYAWRVFIVNLLMLLIFPCVAISQYPEDEIPILDFGESQKAVSVTLNFTGITTATPGPVEVFYGRAHGRADAPPAYGVGLFDLNGNKTMEFNIWHPLWRFAMDDATSEDNLVIKTEATGEIIFPFAPHIATMTVKEVYSQTEIISVDIIPASHSFCRDNRNDPDCGQVVNRPPNCNAGGPYRKECAGKTTSVLLNGTGSVDLDGDPMMYTWSGSFAGGLATGETSTVQFSGVGNFAVNLGVVDDFGSMATCTSLVAVVDTTPPTIQGVSAGPNMLWPPNHKMVPVLVQVLSSDICDPAPACRISSVSSNEPVNGLGDGDTAPDWVIMGNLTLNLRAERSGTGGGRIYAISVTCTDASGNSRVGTTKVTVPHNQ
jgi:hypothetical protein